MMEFFKNPRDIQLILEVPGSISNFLLDSVSPAMKKLRRQGIINRWSFLRIGRQKPPNETWLFLFCTPSPQVSAAKTGSKVKLLLRDDLRKSGGRFRAELWAPGTLEGHYKRFGGNRGIRIFNLFIRYVLSPLVLDVARLLRASLITSYEAGFCSLAFYLDMLGVPREKLAAGVSSWHRSFAGSLIADSAGRNDILFAAKEQARLELNKNKFLSGLLKNLMEKGWKKSGPPPLTRIFMRYERHMKRIGGLLRTNQTNFSPTHPWLFVVFHSYIHTHCAHLGFGGWKELFLYLIFYEWLSASHGQTVLK